MTFSGLQLVTPATATPVTLLQIKDHLGIGGNYSDARLQSYLDAAVDLIENETNLCLCTQTWKESYSQFPNFRSLETKRAPIQSVTSLTYYDQTNTQQTLVQNTDFYFQTYYKAPAVLTPTNSTSELLFPDFPQVYRSRPDAVQLTYVAGWTTTDNVWQGPDRAIHAIKILVTYWSDGNRGANDLEMPCGFDRLLAGLNFGWYQ